MKRPLLYLAVLAAGCGGKSTQDWIAQLGDRDSAQRLRAVKALGGRRSEADIVVPALAGALQDENAFVRRDAAEALGAIGPEARPAAPALTAALRDRNAPVRRAAARALEKLGVPAAARPRGR
jgi:HEAT repeat protein